MQKFSELKLCHAFFHSKEGGTKARNLLKYAWKGPWKEVPLNHFSFPGSSPPFTFASYRNNFFSPISKSRDNADAHWATCDNTRPLLREFHSNVESWWCCAVTSDLLPWTECPSRIFPQSHNPEAYFQHSASCAYFRSRISLPFSFEIPNPALQMKQIPDPEQPIGDHRKACAQEFVTRARVPSTSHLTRRRVQAIDELQILFFL